MVRCGTKLVGAVVADATLKGLLKVDRKKLEDVEVLLNSILTAYCLKSLPQAPLDGLLKARVAFSCRAGEALAALSRGTETVPEGEATGASELDTRGKLAVAESKLRAVLTGSGARLPDRVAGQSLRFKANPSIGITWGTSPPQNNSNSNCSSNSTSTSTSTSNSNSKNK